MASIRRLAFLLAVPLALAGCIGTDDEPVDQNTVDPLIADELPTGPVVTEVEGMIQASASTPVRTINFGGVFASPLGSFTDSNGFVVEVTWSAASPASESLAVWIRETGVGNIAPENAESLLLGSSEPDLLTEGSGPLRLVIPAGTLDESLEYEILLRAAGPVGAAVNQPYTLFIANFVGVDFDETFTAL